MRFFKITATANPTRRRRLFRRFKEDDGGATAQEFALVSIPFLLILFGIIELAIVFFVSSALNHATSEAGRLVRVGRFQGCATEAAQFKAVICGKMGNMGNCSRNLRVDVITDDKFTTLALDPAPIPEETKPGEDPPTVGDGVYQETNGGENVVIRATFDYRLALPEKMTRLGNPPGKGVRQLYALTAFRNEPFSAPTSCEKEVQEAIDAGLQSADDKDKT